MSNETQEIDTDVFETGEDQPEQDEAGDSSAAESEAAQEESEGSDVTSSEDELIVTIEGAEQESEQEDGKPQNLPNHLRKLLRESERARRELEAKLSQNAPKQDDGPPVKPEIGSEEIDYDPDKFAQAMDEYVQKKIAYDNRQQAIRRQQEEVAKEWEAVQQTYAKGKARFPKEKMAEAEEEVVSVLPANRQAMLMDMADDSAALVVALGSSPETLRKLASIKSDAKFVKELAKIEMNVKVQSKKTPPPPERTISGSGKTPGAGQANLDRLREQAEKTGDYTEYYAAKAKAKAR